MNSFFLWQLNPFALPQAVAALICLISAGLMWRHRRDSPGAVKLGFLLLCAAEWALAGALEFCAGSMPGKILLSQISYFGVMAAPWALFRFAVSYTEQEDTVPRWVEPLLATTAVLAIVAAFTNGWHGWLWRSVTPVRIGGYIFANYQHGPLFWGIIIYCYGLMLSSCMLLLRYAVFTAGIYRFQSLVIVLATICPWFTSIAYLLRIGPYPDLDQTPVGFAFGALLMSWNVLQWRLFEVSPVAAHTLFAKMSDPVLVVDPLWRVVHANPAALAHFGLRENQQGRPLEEVMRRAPALAASLARAEGEIWSDTAREGATWWNIEATALKDRRGDPRGWLFVFRDTTEIKQAEIDLRRIKDEVEEARMSAVAADEAKTRFLASISHEIRTPLNAVAGYSQILRDRKEMPPEALTALNAIHQASDHLLDLIEAVLDLSKIEAGKMDVIPQDFEIGALLRSVHSIFAQTCQEKGVALVVATPSAEPLWVHGDDRKLRQVLVNLVSNAVKFTDHGAIRISAARVAGAQDIHFEVADTGAGLDAASQAIIFEEFEQTGDGRGKGGTGLGLAISRKLVSLLGGALHLRSAPGQGSIFSFQVRLPVVREKAARTGGSLRPRLAEGCSVRALVVDDMKVNRDVLGYLLKSVRCEVREAGTGEAAIESYREHGADIIFLDMNMKHPLEGMEVASVLRDNGAGERPRIVCYSASAFEHQWQEFRKAGFDDFLVKPVRFDRVRECLERLPGVKFVEG